MQKVCHLLFAQSTPAARGAFGGDEAALFPRLQGGFAEADDLLFGGGEAFHAEGRRLFGRDEADAGGEVVRPRGLAPRRRRGQIQLQLQFSARVIVGGLDLHAARLIIDDAHIFAAAVDAVDLAGDGVGAAARPQRDAADGRAGVAERLLGGGDGVGGAFDLLEHLPADDDRLLHQRAGGKAARARIGEVAIRRGGEQLFGAGAHERLAGGDIGQAGDGGGEQAQQLVHVVARIQRAHALFFLPHQAQAALGKVAVGAGKIALDEGGGDRLLTAEQKLRRGGRERLFPLYFHGGGVPFFAQGGKKPGMGGKIFSAAAVFVRTREELSHGGHALAGDRGKIGAEGGGVAPFIPFVGGAVEQFDGLAPCIREQGGDRLEYAARPHFRPPLAGGAGEVQPLGKAAEGKACVFAGAGVDFADLGGDLHLQRAEAVDIFIGDDAVIRPAGGHGVGKPRREHDLCRPAAAFGIAAHEHGV